MAKQNVTYESDIYLDQEHQDEVVDTIRKAYEQSIDQAIKNGNRDFALKVASPIIMIGGLAVYAGRKRIMRGIHAGTDKVREAFGKPTKWDDELKKPLNDDDIVSTQ